MTSSARSIEDELRSTCGVRGAGDRAPSEPEAAFDRDSWLRHCQGFRVDGSGGRLGFVDDIITMDDGKVLAVGADRLGRRILLISPDEVARWLGFHQHMEVLTGKREAADVRLRADAADAAGVGAGSGPARRRHSPSDRAVGVRARARRCWKRVGNGRGSRPVAAGTCHQRALGCIAGKSGWRRLAASRTGLHRQEVGGSSPPSSIAAPLGPSETGWLLSPRALAPA